MSKIQNWLPWLACLLIIIGQFYYLPERLSFLRQLFAFAHTTDPLEVARTAYSPADYDLLAWVKCETSSDTILLLVTTSPQTYRDPSYVVYHRAIYHLYPRSVWWAAPVPPTHYPTWWTFTDLSETDILDIAQKHQATAILADGFTQPPLPGLELAFDADTYLIFLRAREPQPEEGKWTRGMEDNNTSPIVSGRWSVVGGRFLWVLGALLSIWLWGDLIYGQMIGCYLPPSLVRRLAMGWLLGCGVISLGTFVLLWVGMSLAMSVTSLSLLGCLLWLATHHTFIWEWPARLPSFGMLIAGLRSKHALRPMRTTLGEDRSASGDAPLLRRYTKLPLRFLVSSSPRPLRVTSAPLRLLFTFIIAIQIGLVAFAAWASPLTDWDAWVNWASKANALFIDQTLSPNLYHNPARLPTNMDYPLLLPLTEAWFYTWLGQIDEPAVGLISLLFYLALLLLFYHAARLLVSPTAALGFTALLATIPRLERPAHSGLADIPLAALVLLSFLLLFESYKSLSHQKQSPLPSRSPAPLLGSSPPRLSASPLPLLALVLSTGLLPWLKNEGWLWWLLVSLSLLVGLSLLVRRGHLSSHQATILALAYLLLALSIPLLWQCFLTIYGTYRFTFLPLTLATFWTNLSRLPEIGANILTRLLNPYWNFIWFFAGLVLGIRGKKVGLAPVSWMILPVVGYLGLVSLSYVFSRFEPYLAHLNNSAERLILQATPLVWWWLIGQCISMGWVKNDE